MLEYRYSPLIMRHKRDVVQFHYIKFGFTIKKLADQNVLSPFYKSGTTSDLWSHFFYRL